MLLHRGNLYLVGLMGAGKTTLGRQLARRLAKRFVDADHELEERLGVNIPTIFEIEGEAAFRDREEAVIAELVPLENIVLGTGGGAVAARGEPRAPHGGRHRRLPACRPGDAVRARAPQPAPADAAAPRIRRARIAELYAQRDPLYRAIADHVIESDRDEVMRFARALGHARARARARGDARRVKRLDVALGERSYPITSAAARSPARARCSPRRAPRARSSSPTRPSPRTISRRCARRSSRAGVAIDVVLVPDGEAHKNLGDAATTS